MTNTENPRRVIDLDALADGIADGLMEPTYVLDSAEVGTEDGFARFEATVTERGLTWCTIRAVVDMVSNGEDAIEGAAGEVIEIVVRYPAASA